MGSWYFDEQSLINLNILAFLPRILVLRLVHAE